MSSTNPTRNDNARTLATYNSSLQAYVDTEESKLPRELQEFILSALSHLNSGARILELGSGSGRDADWIEQHGFKVERTDAADSFLKFMQAQGHPARRLDLLTDELGGPYGLIYASAVLLHFDLEETRGILRKIEAALAPAGILALRLKQGNAASWTDERLNAPRYMHYWNPDELSDELKDAGLSIISSITKTYGRGKHTWIHVIAKKKSKA